MESKIPDMAAVVAKDTSHLAGAAVGVAIEGAITLTKVGADAAQLPGDVAAIVQQHLAEALRTLAHFFATGEAPK